jgi:hypothetical protein
MAKNVQSQILSKVTDLFNNFAGRLARLGVQTGKNTAAIEALQDKQRVNVGTLSESIKDAQAETARVKQENDDRETRQTLRDQNNVQSLVNLRDSVQKAFIAVEGDIESLVKSSQRLNERIGQAESQNLILASRVNAIAQETLSAGALPQGHIWVNKKLSGVYDTTDDLEKRVKELEAILALYENLRKAQAALAQANGQFVTEKI